MSETSLRFLFLENPWQRKPSEGITKRGALHRGIKAHLQASEKMAGKSTPENQG